MKVSFSIGVKSSTIIESMVANLDNVEFSTYPSISDMIKDSTTRNVYFDRIIFSEKIVTDAESEFLELSNYLMDYCPNTEVIIIFQKGNVSKERDFTRILNSPLYTPVLLSKVTITMLISTVKDDVQELRAKYYSLDIKNEMRSQNDSKSNSEKPVNTSPKKGFFGGMFSKKGSNGGNNENKNSSENVVEDTSNTVESAPVSKVEISTPKLDNDTPTPSHVGTSSHGSCFEENENNSVTSNTPVHHEADISSSDLSVGGFGGQHFDTGYLDEAELEADLRAFEMAESNIDGVAPSPIDSEDVTPYVNEEPREVHRDTPSVAVSGNLVVFSGDRNVGVVPMMLDRAVSLVNEGKTVLCIDYDTKCHTMLSYISDISDFYAKGCASGLDRGIVYNEDGIDILSNGYGISSIRVSLDDMKRSGVFDKYDYVFIDCPLDCLEWLDGVLDNSYSVVFNLEGDRFSLLSFLEVVTSRGTISASFEDELFDISSINILHKNEFYDEDVDFIRSNCLFGRGNWATKL